MAEKTVSVRLSEELVRRIQQQYPEFDRNAGRGGAGSKSEIVRELIERGLGSDPAQAIEERLAETHESSRDIQNEIRQLRSDLSVVLELVLLNLSGDPEEAARIIALLKEKGAITQWSPRSR